MNNSREAALNPLLVRTAGAIGRVGARDEDSAVLRLQKALLVGGSLTILPAALLWGALYLIYGEIWAGVVTLGYAAITILGILYLSRTGDKHLFAFVQLLCTLLLPLLLTVLLGGIVNSSAVILGALMCPLGALLYYNVPRAARWFVAYVIVVALAGLFDSMVRRPNGLPTWLIVTLFVLNVSTVSAIAFFMLQNFIRQRERAMAMLRQEQAKSEGLLLNVLPEKIATLLKEEQETIAERFDVVSVFFADVVGFTQLSAEVDPVALVDALNEVFNYFDTVVEKYGLEKIRTMGDNYMVASGVPTPRPDHAHVLAEAALEMMEYVTHCPSFLARELQFRGGINAGPAVAGIIGHTKFHYDVWGDPVNVAARMESHGEPGRIQIGRDFYVLIKDEFMCEPRGRIVVKGKGEMETWFLVGRKGVNGAT
jgi:guanylate cyclase